MTCADCGRACSGRLCRECERDRRWEAEFERTLGEDASESSTTTSDGGVTVAQAKTETDAFVPVVDAPAPAECARELEGKPGVHAVHTEEDCKSVAVVVTLASAVEAVPRSIVRALYRRRLAIVDVAPVAGRQHLRVETRPTEGPA